MPDATTRRRNILFITTDQQRYDSLGCNGGTVARTPVIDRLAAEGINYRRAYNQNTVCMPARSTMLTGQYVRTHGVVANGIPLPTDAPSVAAVPGRERRATAPPCWARRTSSRASTRICSSRRTPGWPAATPDPGAASNAPSRPCTPPRGATTRSPTTAAGWPTNHPEHLHSFAGLLQAEPGGRHDGAGDEEQPDPARVVPHRLGGRSDGRLAQLARRRRAVVLLDVLPRPAPPVGPARRRSCPGCRGRTSTSRPGIPARDDAIRAVLARKPAHWLAYWEGRFPNMEGGPAAFVPSRLTNDQIREVNAKVHVMNELIDEACGRVLRHHRRPGLAGRRPTSSSPPTTARCRATSGSSTRARTTPTP